MTDSKDSTTSNKRRGKKETLREQVERLEDDLTRSKKLVEISERMAAAGR